MRELKFRAYDTRLKMWCYDGEGFNLFGEVLMVDGFSSHFRENPIEGLGSLDRIYTDIKVMQFTGLHDKNGKEIYEGDILKGSLYNWKVFWHQEHACFAVESPPSVAEIIDNQNMTIIGNIYENPDLTQMTNHLEP